MTADNYQRQDDMVCLPGSQKGSERSRLGR